MYTFSVAFQVKSGAVKVIFQEIKALMGEKKKKALINCFL